MMKWKKNLKTNKQLSQYPCIDYLHNALRFIAEGKPEIAYSEICNAITKSGGELTGEEGYELYYGAGNYRQS